MPKAGELDWSELYKTGKNLEPEHPLSKPIKEGLKAEEHVQEFGKTIAQEVVDGFKEDGIRQPTDEEMFGGLVKTEEEIREMKAAAKKQWDEKLHAYNDWKPAKVVRAHNHDPDSWGTGEPILSREEREELAKANREEIRKLM